MNRLCLSPVLLPGLSQQAIAKETILDVYRAVGDRCRRLKAGRFKWGPPQEV
jgi:hypothetical protein